MWSEEELNISCLYCLPLASARRSEVRPNDWTCIILGTVSGDLLFLTEKGNVVYKEKYSNCAVKSVHFAWALHGCQELSVLYEDVLVSGVFSNVFCSKNPLRGTQ